MSPTPMGESRATTTALRCSGSSRACGSRTTVLWSVPMKAPASMAYGVSCPVRRTSPVNRSAWSL